MNIQSKKLYKERPPYKPVVNSEEIRNIKQAKNKYEKFSSIRDKYPLRKIVVKLVYSGFFDIGGHNEDRVMGTTIRAASSLTDRLLDNLNQEIKLGDGTTLYDAFRDEINKKLKKHVKELYNETVEYLVEHKGKASVTVVDVKNNELKNIIKMLATEINVPRRA